MDASGRACSFAHHACNAPGTAIVSHGKSMACPEPWRQELSLFGIFDRNRVPFADFNPKSSQDMTREIYDEVPRREGDSPDHFYNIKTLKNI